MVDEILNEPKLLPCPFCGGEALINLHNDEYVYCFCESCGIEQPTYTNRNVAVRAWNKRYTGLNDKNGIKIFEGDIVKTQFYYDRPYSDKRKCKQFIGVVKYHVRHFKNSLHEQDYEAYWKVDIQKSDADEKYCHGNWSDFFECEVIGNIYDNPELLKQ